MLSAFVAISIALSMWCCVYDFRVGERRSEGVKDAAVFGRLFFADLFRDVDDLPRLRPLDPGVSPCEVCGRSATLPSAGEGVDTAGREGDAPGRRSSPGIPLLLFGRGGICIFSRLDSWPALEEGLDRDLTFFPDNCPGTRLAVVSFRELDNACWSSSTFLLSSTSFISLLWCVGEAGGERRTSCLV